MKIGLAALLSLLILVFGGLAPSTARADTPIDCTAGCYIITCNTTVCSLWRCDARGCRLQSTWPRETADQPLSAGRAGKPAKPTDDVAHAKVCPENQRCELYELTAREAIHLGSFDNVDDLANYRRSPRSPAIPVN